MAGKRRLSAEEKALLDHALRDVVPLKAGRIRPQEPQHQELPEQPKPAPKRKTKAKPRAQPAPAAEKRKPPPAPQHLDERTRRKLVRGRQDIDAKLDLHGLRQDEAYARLSYFIEAASQKGARTLLIITGKGSRAGIGDAYMTQGETRGVLRANLPRWLAEPRFRAHVWAVEEAGPRHGGGGAYYVLLRRRKD